MGGVRVSGFFGRGSIIELFFAFPTGDPVIFHTGKFPHTARDRPQMFKRKIETDVAVKFAICRIARITFFRAPNLAARVAVARERSWTRGRITWRINRALRLRIAEQQSVRVENEPSNIRFLQNRVEAGRISTFGQPKARWIGLAKIDMTVAPGDGLRAGRCP